VAERTLEQLRAANALACVEAVKAQPGNIPGLYRSYAESLPVHIVMGGLGQALATELAAARGADGDARKDGNRAHERLVNDLAKWLGQKSYAQVEGRDVATKLMAAIAAGDQDKYVQAQAEALAWLVWLKKFCQAMLPKTSED